MLAAALAGRAVRVEIAEVGVPAWTDGHAIYLDGDASARTQLKELCVQCALLTAGSLDREIVRHLARHPKLANRYLAVEGQRALAALDSILPPLVQPVIDAAAASLSSSPAASLAFAMSRESIAHPAKIFGAIRVRELLAANANAGAAASNGRHAPRQALNRALVELPDRAQEDDEAADIASSPVGGGGGLGKLLQKMFQRVRRVSGNGPPGADAPTHWSRTPRRAGARGWISTAVAAAQDNAFGKRTGVLYPEWNVHRQCYQPDWCTVLEIDPPCHAVAPVQWHQAYGLRKPLSRLGMELERCHRQAQGDEIDLDAAVEAHVDVLAQLAPREFCYVDSQRRRRDLSVLVLLDISGSVSQPSMGAAPVHEQQRGVAAALTTVLHAVGDRIALYAFHSQGRSAVHLLPVKRFDDGLDNAVISRLHSLVPGAYSRLGAAIRHGATLLLERSGTSRRLLVLLSDGLAYDHGYEPAYGAADARQALAEARRDGVGCLCLSVGAGSDIEVLRRVFGSAAFAAVPEPGRLGQVIGPLFRSALQAATVQRHAAGYAMR